MGKELALLYLFVFAFGLAIGSFLNVCIFRLHLKISIAKGRSFCPNCKSKIAWYDNIPVLSYLLLKAKCRNCKQSISWVYPAVELLTALLFALSFWKFGLSWQFFSAMFLFSALLLFAFIVFNHQ